MPSKILSFICHVPGLTPGAYPAVPTTPKAPAERPERRASSSSSPSNTSSSGGGHFAAIYENERFVRFKYINNQ
ncbi:hypothetical protein [Hymenobacter sp. DG25A]|jgi:hypothetical protein|uniref:hypothetical protein n=1 Tax=Hymenobacter sp. DG25A TaxID=1385663 RepID=UPI0006BE0611|nr:hypothetical protein [Hymenobacter sp. DG25A]ALD21409.1 hypothetical protein AM218_09495 [Hymenobacter sp. DG25A]